MNKTTNIFKHLAIYSLSLSLAHFAHAEQDSHHDVAATSENMPDTIATQYGSLRGHVDLISDGSLHVVSKFFQDGEQSLPLDAVETLVFDGGRDNEPGIMLKNGEKRNGRVSSFQDGTWTLVDCDGKTTIMQGAGEQLFRSINFRDHGCGTPVIQKNQERQAGAQLRMTFRHAELPQQIDKSTTWGLIHNLKRNGIDFGDGRRLNVSSVWTGDWYTSRSGYYIFTGSLSCKRCYNYSVTIDGKLAAHSHYYVWSEPVQLSEGYHHFELKAEGEGDLRNLQASLGISVKPYGENGRGVSITPKSLTNVVD